MPADLSAPGRDCPLCPRLAAFRDEQRAAHPDWFNAPVPAFGEISARLLIAGLAPGLKGANRTGRPFTGDHAGDLLYSTLSMHRFATGAYGRHTGDGLTLADCRITNAVRCVPPQNKPVGAETAACSPFLTREIASMPNLKVILSLGTLSHNAVLKALGLRQSTVKFSHGAVHSLGGDRPLLANSYHCSRYNTNTGRLTEAMFSAVFADLRRLLDTD